MLTKLYTFETGYHFRQTAWWLAAAAFAGLGIVASRGNFGGDDVHRNSPYAIAVVLSLLSLCTIFAATIFSAGALLRDKTSRMDALVFTTGIRRTTYLGIKFAGLATAVFALLCLAAIGAGLGSLTLEASARGPFSILHYLQPLLVFGLPNVLLTCALLFSLALLTWSPKAVYAGGILLYILYLTASIFSGSPLLAGATGSGQGWAANLSDPYGLAPFFGGTRYWTDVERNTRLYPLSGALLLNRAIWMLLAAGLLAWVYRKFRFSAEYADASPNKAQLHEHVPPKPYAAAGTQTAGVPYYLAAFGARLRLEVRAVCLHVPFLLMMALWAFYMIVELQGSLTGFYGIKTIAGSGQIAQHLLSVRPAILLIIFYAAELTFAERASRISGMIDSTPLPPGILWAGKCAALAVMAAVIVSVNVMVGIGTQLMEGVLPIRFSVYAWLYVYGALPLALQGVLAVCILTLTGRKFAGMMLCLVAVVPVLFGSRFGMGHPMLRFALPPQYKWSDMDGFGREALTFGWWMLYWGALAAAMGVVTVRAWRSGVKGVFGGWDAPARLALLGFLLAFIVSGGYIFSRMHGRGGYKSEEAAMQWKADYEKTVKPLVPASLPTITSINTHIQLFPQSGEYTVDGSYVLRNNGDTGIDTLLIGESPEMRSWRISVEDATPVGENERLGVRWIRLNTRLRPGDSMLVRFHIEADRSGFIPFNSEHSVARNGSYVELDKHLPWFGYNAGLELETERERISRGLPAVSANPRPDPQYYRIRYHTIITTDAGQTALAPGNLVRRWEAAGRAYFEYATEGPAPDGLAISSARYAEQSIRHKNRRLTVYYHPGHATHVPGILDGMRAALDYGEVNYALYPFKSLVMAEIPAYPGAATAYPGLMFAKESVLFTADYSDTSTVNFAYATAAHETAHQWWAHLLTPLGDSSYKFLTETMAKHVESRVLERRYGRAKHEQYLAADRQYYLQMRAHGKELPVVKSADQNWVHYQKGALAMDTLTQFFGESRVNAGMRELMRLYTPPNAKPTGEWLLQIWEKDANVREKEMLERWFRQTEVIR